MRKIRRYIPPKVKIDSTFTGDDVVFVERNERLHSHHFLLYSSFYEFEKSGV